MLYITIIYIIKHDIYNNNIATVSELKIVDFVLFYFSIFFYFGLRVRV